MIYFTQPVSGGPIKIGYSANVPGRIKALEAHYGQGLAVLATMKGDLSVESSLHERFSHLRFGRTEQFRPASDLLEFIGRPLLVDPNPDAVEVVSPVNGRKPMVIQVRGNEEWKAWIEELAALEGDTVAKYVERLARKHAREIGFREMPKR